VAFRNFRAVADFLTNTGTPPLPPGYDPKIFSYEATGFDADPGTPITLTGNIVRSAPRTTGAILPNLLKLASAPFSGPSSLLAPLTQEYRNENLVQPQTNIVGRVPMGFFDDIFGGSDSTDAVGSGFNSGISGGSSFDWTGLLNTGVGLAGQIIRGGGGSQGVPTQFGGASMAAVPMVIGAGGAVMRGGGAMIAARLASLGLNRSTAYTMLKKFGPASLIGLGLTAVEVAQVAKSKGGYRRMNMCNGRALRRASRRLEGFHRFYKKTCGLPVHQRKSKKYCK
jgi:hypothetical protein